MRKGITRLQEKGRAYAEQVTQDEHTIATLRQHLADKKDAVRQSEALRKAAEASAHRLSSEINQERAARRDLEEKHQAQLELVEDVAKVGVFLLSVKEGSHESAP